MLWHNTNAAVAAVLLCCCCCCQDHFLNAANWMWLSASAFFNQYYRVYSPVTFGKKYDPEGKFIRRCVTKGMTDPAVELCTSYLCNLTKQEVRLRGKFIKRCVLKGMAVPADELVLLRCSKECEPEGKPAGSIS